MTKDEFEANYFITYDTESVKIHKRNDISKCNYMCHKPPEDPSASFEAHITQALCGALIMECRNRENKEAFAKIIPILEDTVRRGVTKTDVIKEIDRIWK